MTFCSCGKAKKNAALDVLVLLKLESDNIKGDLLAARTGEVYRTKESLLSPARLLPTCS